MPPAVLASKPFFQLARSGATSVDPAPFSSAAEAAAVESEAMLPSAPTTAIEIPSNLLRIKRGFLSARYYRRQDLSRVMGSCVNCVKRGVFQKCEKNVTVTQLVSI